MTAILCKAEGCKHNKDDVCIKMIVTIQFMRTDNPCCYDFDDYEPPENDNLEIDPEFNCL